MYRLLVGDDDWCDYRIKDGERWRLPALVCRTCGSRWSTTGESYPAMHKERFTAGVEWSVPPVLGNERFRELVSIAPADQLGIRRPKPGSEIGPFVGRGRGRPKDLVWARPWTVFLSERAIESMTQRGVPLPKLVKADLIWKRSDVTSAFFEPAALPLIRLSRRGLERPETPPCSDCGRENSRYLRFAVPDEERLPVDVHLCRSSDNPTLLLVSERFAQVLAEEQLTGASVERLPRESEL